MNGFSSDPNWNHDLYCFWDTSS